MFVVLWGCNCKSGTKSSWLKHSISNEVENLTQLKIIQLGGKMFSNAIKMLAFSSAIFSSAVLADADDWEGYNRYVGGYGYAPVVEEELIVTPRGVVEEEIVYVPERVVEVQSMQPRYYAPAPIISDYGYVQQIPMYARRDWDGRW
jgi:hypothetical protein